MKSFYYPPSPLCVFSLFVYFFIGCFLWTHLGRILDRTQLQALIIEHLDAFTQNGDRIFLEMAATETPSCTHITHKLDSFEDNRSWKGKIGSTDLKLLGKCNWISYLVCEV